MDLENTALSLKPFDFCSGCGSFVGNFVPVAFALDAFPRCDLCIVVVQMCLYIVFLLVLFAYMCSLFVTSACRLLAFLPFFRVCFFLFFGCLFACLFIVVFLRFPFTRASSCGWFFAVVIVVADVFCCCARFFFFHLLLLMSSGRSRCCLRLDLTEAIDNIEKNFLLDRVAGQETRLTRWVSWLRQVFHVSEFEDEICSLSLLGQHASDS